MQATLKIVYIMVGLFGHVVSITVSHSQYPGKDTEQVRSPGAVFDQIFETLKSANKGITSSELASAARRIATDSDVLAGDVSAEDVDNIIKEIATSISSSSILASLFDDNLNFDFKVINDALALLEGLAQRGRELADANKPTEHILAAISKTAKAIEAVVKDIDEIVNYEESKNLNNNGTAEVLNKDVLLISEDGPKNTISQETANKIEKRRICIEWRIIWKRGRICVRWG